MIVELLFYDDVGKYKKGQVFELEDGVFLRAVLKNGMADVVNPPDWSPEIEDAKRDNSYKIENITKSKRVSKTPSETN